MAINIAALFACESPEGIAGAHAIADLIHSVMFQKK